MHDVAWYDSMRIGYLFRGFLGDIKHDASNSEISTPDGNATYSWSIEHECNKRGYKLIPLGENLDAPAAMLFGDDLFNAFSKQKRSSGYERMIRNGWMKLSDKLFPDLDLVLIEWRWPIPGKNTINDKKSVQYQNDLERQLEVLHAYGARGTPIVIWDLDHKLTDFDEEDITHRFGIKGDVDIIETAVNPNCTGKTRHRVEPPFVMSELLQHSIDEKMPSHHLGYIGSRYERDETIDKWIGSIAPKGTHRVKFWGKWEPADDVKIRWPGINFAGRIGVKDFKDAYSRVAAVPLLAKKSYYSSGFITPRPWEAILFGSMPIGLNEHLGISQYCEYVANNPQHLLELATWIRTISPIRRNVIREEAAHRLYYMDVSNFVNVLEGLVGKDVAV
jgi:hypothetical protein